MNILVIPDSFKGSLSASEVADIMEKTVKKVFPKSNCLNMPFSDGGEGAMKVLASHSEGKIQSCTTEDPLQRVLKANYFLFSDNQSVWIELSQTAGLTLLQKEERNPLHTTTRGTGLMIREALDQGCSTIYLGIGGSATQDLGSGIIQALGGRFLDEFDTELPLGGGALSRLKRIDLRDLHPQARICKWIIACDVENKLLGIHGSAHTYAKQKGASNQDITLLEQGAKQFTAVIHQQFGKDITSLKGGGAAGGVSAGLFGVLGATLANGFELLADLTNLSKTIPTVDLILTGEGSFDEQSLYGKLPIQVATLGDKKDIPTFIFAGKAKLKELKQMQHCKIIDCTPEGMSVQQAMSEAASNLERALLRELNSLTLK